jgi:hypothetical protein
MCELTGLRIGIFASLENARTQLGNPFNVVVVPVDSVTTDLICHSEKMADFVRSYWNIQPTDDCQDDFHFRIKETLVELARNLSSRVSDWVAVEFEYLQEQQIKLPSCYVSTDFAPHNVELRAVWGEIRVDSPLEHGLAKFVHNRWWNFVENTVVSEFYPCSTPTYFYKKNV